MSDVLAALGVKRIINAYGTNTRLSAGAMAPEVVEAMAAANGAAVEMHGLQAAASRAIAAATGAEAGIVTAGASAAILLGAAACMARLDPGAMNRLPDATGLPDEFLIARSQRNMYDKAVRVAGGRLVELGIPDRYAGAGVRDAEPWEYADAIGPRTAAIYWLAGPGSEPPLRALAEVARARHIPVLVDAAGQLPPRENLRRFLAEGADLVCFSGGKAIGGPQASGILAGRRDLVSSALAQMLDMDFPPGEFRAPAEFAPLNQLRGLPHHGVGRSAKVAKEGVVGLLAALRIFTGEDAAARTARWEARLAAVRAAAGDMPGVAVAVRPDGAKPGLPLLELRFASPAAAAAAEAALRAGDPAVHLDAGRMRQGVLAVNPLALRDAEVPALGAALAACCGRGA